MKVRIDDDRCQGHGRCYSLAPELFEADDLGNARVVGDGSVPPEHEAAARKAATNCPEYAVIIEEDG